MKCRVNSIIIFLCSTCRNGYENFHIQFPTFCFFSVCETAYHRYRSSCGWLKSEEGWRERKKIGRLFTFGLLLLPLRNIDIKFDLFSLCWRIFYCYGVGFVKSFMNIQNLPVEWGMRLLLLPWIGNFMQKKWNKQKF